MAITIEKRPEKTIASGNKSTLNSVVTAAAYELRSDLFPVDKVQGSVVSESISFDTVKRRTRIISVDMSVVINALDYVFITNSGIKELDGKFFEVTEAVQGAVQDIYIDINIGSQTSITGKYSKYYNNYSARVKVFGGFPSSHKKAIDGTKTMIEIDEHEVFFYQENGENVGRIDVSKIVASQLDSKFIAGDNENTNNINLLSSFTIEVAEAFDVSDGNSTSLVIGEYLADVTLENAEDYFRGLENPDFNTANGVGWVVSPNEENTTGSVAMDFVSNYVEIVYNIGVDVNNSKSEILNQDVLLDGLNTYSGSIEVDVRFTVDPIKLSIIAKDGFGNFYVLKEEAVIQALGSQVFTFDTSLITEDIFGIGLMLEYDVATPFTDSYRVWVKNFRVSSFVGFLNPTFEEGPVSWVLTPSTSPPSDLAITFTDENNGQDYWLKIFNETGGDHVFSQILNQNVEVYANVIHTIKINYNIKDKVGNVSFNMYLYGQFMQNFIISEKGEGFILYEFTPNDTEIINIGFLIESEPAVASNYEINIDNFQVTNAFSDYAIRYVEGIFGTNQFQNIDGGNMGKNLIQDVSLLSNEKFYPQIITDFKECRAVNGTKTLLNAYVSSSALTYDSPIRIEADVFAKDGTLIAEDVVLSTLANEGFGVYLTQINIQTVLDTEFIQPEDWSYIIVDYSVSNPSIQLTEKKRYNNVIPCRKGHEIRWLNSRGGWEHWHFEHYSKEEEENSEFNYIEHDTYQSLGDDFANGDTTEELVNLSSRPVITLFTGWLTEDEAKILQRLRRSIKVQVLVNHSEEGYLDAWQTTRINGSKVVTVDRTKKLRELSFKMKLPKILVQNL